MVILCINVRTKTMLNNEHKHQFTRTIIYLRGTKRTIIHLLVITH